MLIELTTVEERNIELMQKLDDAWNKQDWEVFRKRQSQDTAVYWPGQPEPTKGRHNHEKRKQKISSRHFQITT